MLGEAVNHINKRQERGSGLFNEEDEEVGGEGDQRNETPATWR